MKSGGLKRSQIVGVGLLRRGLGLDFLVQIEFGRMHLLGELLGLPGQFADLGHGVLGRVGEGRGAQHARDHGGAGDGTRKPLLSMGFGEGDAVKHQGFCIL